jgi:mono/diheme cytochrome c family protein
MRRMIGSRLVGGCAALLLPAIGIADAAETVRESCGSCHALEQPSYDSLGVAERAERIAPPLFYAGDKFREEWLASWLEAPTRLRPAGVFSPAHTVVTPEGDVVDAATLVEHPALPPDEAAIVAAYLMTLKPFAALLAEQTYEPGTVALRMGQMNFSKFKGCDSCHWDEPDFGGVSGPELYTAWERLQPSFIVAFIKDATRFDPHTMMPESGLNDGEAHKLADYLKALAEANQ